MILSSHILPEIEAVCDRIVVINKGAIVADDTASDLSKKYSSDRRTLIRVAGPRKMCWACFPACPACRTSRPSVKRSRACSSMRWIPLKARTSAGSCSTASRPVSGRFMGMKSMEMTLEEIFIADEGDHPPRFHEIQKRG